MTEGEKAADAAASLLPEPNYVSITSMNGAKSPAKSDWALLAGRVVLIWPDHDAAGYSYAQTVLSLLSGIAAHTRILDLEPFRLLPGGAIRDLPEGWDAANALQDRYSTESITGLIQSALDRFIAIQNKEAPEGLTAIQDLTLPRLSVAADTSLAPSIYTSVRHVAGYQLIRDHNALIDGVYYIGMDEKGKPKKPEFISSPIWVSARTRNRHGENWGYLLEWVDQDNGPHRWAMPAEMLAGSGEEYRRLLLEGGLSLSPGGSAKSHLSAYIQTCPTERRALCVDTTGWHEVDDHHCFVMPHRALPESVHGQVIFQSSGGAPNYFSQSGTLEEWQKNVASLCIDNSRPTFTVSHGFGAIVAGLLGVENGGVHLVGPSSIGKTSALYAAASLFGGRDYIHQWRATSNGLEAIANAHDGALLILDELSQADPIEAWEIAYMLANGAGKHRANRTGGARRTTEWRLTVLSSGEVDLAQHLESIGKKSRAGQDVRMIAIPAQASIEYGLFEELHGLETSAMLAAAIYDSTRRYYGTAAIAFIEAICANVTEVISVANELRRQFVEDHLPAGATGQVVRGCGRFALAAVGGEMATYLGITGWPAGEATRSAAACFHAWLEHRGGAGNQETTTILAQVRGFLAKHGASRFGPKQIPSVPPGEEPFFRVPTTQNRCGAVEYVDDHPVYYVTTEAFRQEICAGLDHRHALRVIEGAGWLKRGSDGRPAANHRLWGFGLIRCYVICPREPGDQSKA